MPSDVLGARTLVVAYAEAFAFSTTEALIPLAVQRQGAALIAAAGNSLTVPAGKVFRLESIVATLTSSGTAVTFSRLRLRAILGSTTLAVTSPIQGPNTRLGFAANPAASWVATPVNIPIPEGLEFPAGATVVVSGVAAAAGHVVDVTLMGFDYNA